MKQPEDELKYPFNIHSEYLECLYHPIVDEEGEIISYQDFIEKYQL